MFAMVCDLRRELFLFRVSSRGWLISFVGCGGLRRNRDVRFVLQVPVSHTQTSRKKILMEKEGTRAGSSIYGLAD